MGAWGVGPGGTTGAIELGMATITINGREFSVTTRETKHDSCQYVLTGKRGAVYATMRNANDRSRMFLISGMGLARGLSKNTVWLTDARGSLEVVSS